MYASFDVVALSVGVQLSSQITKIDAMVNAVVRMHIFGWLKLPVFQLRKGNSSWIPFI